MTSDGTPETVREPAGDEPHKPLVPGGGADDQHGQVGLGGDALLGLEDGFLAAALLHFLALAIELGKRRRDRGGLRCRPRWRAAARRGRIADPPAGIDARAQHKAQMIGRRRGVQAGRVGQRAQPGILARGA